MRLTDLEPRWVIPGKIFLFRSPCGPRRRQTGLKDWLSIKSVPMKVSDQLELFYATFPDLLGIPIVPCNPCTCWHIKCDDFSNLTVTPSLDASASGNWHGFITNGEVT